MTHTSNDSFWQDRPTLITGATGLVGGWATRRLLASGAAVVCLVRDWVPQSDYVRSALIDRATTVRGDVCDQHLMERVLGEYEIDTVIHLAAQTIVGIANRNPPSTFESNIRGTWSLLEACRRSPTVRQIVVASSDKAYGDAPQLPYDESMPLSGLHPYDASKACADRIAQSYAATFDLPVVITRCGNFYGGGDLNWNRLIPGTIRSVLRGERPVIRSDGKSMRDYFYVEDGAAAYTLLAEKLAADRTLAGQAFNFASGDARLTVLDVVQLIMRTMGSQAEPQILNEARHEIRHQYLNADRATRDLGWSPMFTIDEGLQRTIRWYEDFLGADLQHVEAF